MNDRITGTPGRRFPIHRHPDASMAAGAALLALLCAIGLAPPGVHAASAVPGDLLVLAAGADAGEGGLLRVDRDDGTRTLVSDFGDPAQGPEVARASDLAVTPAGRVLVLDRGDGEVTGALLEVGRSGRRRTLADFGDPRDGPVGSPVAVAVAPDGTILVLVRTVEPGPRDLLVVVDRHGRRALLSDLRDETRGAIVVPAGLTVRADGSIVVLSHVTGGDAPLVEVDRDGQRRVLSQLADGQGPGVELPVAIEESPAGTLLVLEQFADSASGEVIEIAADGTRTISHDLSDPRLGPVTASPTDLAVEADATLLVLDQDAGAPMELPGGGAFLPSGAILVVAPDGTRFVRSDFGDASQGPSFASVRRLAIVPGRDACRARRLAWMRDGAPAGSLGRDTLTKPSVGCR